MAGTPLELGAIEKLLSESRTRGEYEDELRAFIAGSDAGIEVDLTAGALAGKDAKNVYTGFNNARKKMDADTGKPAVEGGAAVKVILKQIDTGEPELDEQGNPVRDDKGNVVNKKEGHVFLINTAKYNPQGAAAEETAEPTADAELAEATA